jgi:hypothetical protein
VTGQSETWLALAREAASAAEHIGIGATALSKANHAENAYYSQAFFALSVGFERSAKLALSVASALEGDGFADRRTLKGYGHDLSVLLKETDALAERYGLEGNGRLPRGEIHTAIIEVLGDFASNLTRYYNLEVVAGDTTAAAEDPITSWFNRVTIPVLNAHDTERSRGRREQKAAGMGVFEDFALVRHHAEDGTPITSMEAGALHIGATEFARRWERMYVLQIARFLGELMYALGVRAQGTNPDIPYFVEFYALYLNEDSFLRSRKTWSIYSH